MTKYYDGFGRLVAVRQVPATGGAGTLYFLLADHLGSTVDVTDTSGNVLATQHYYPYGTVRSGNVTQTDKLFTGQQQEPGDPALGLYDYKARFYSTALGRFVSVDSVTTNGFNLYAYVTDNALRYTDPTGHHQVDDGPGCDAVCGLRALAASGKSSAFWLAFALAIGGGASGNALPPLRFVHNWDASADPSVGRYREMSSDEILDSLYNPSGKDAGLVVYPDGGIANGNARMWVLAERGIEINALPRPEIRIVDTQSSIPGDSIGEGGGTRAPQEGSDLGLGNGGLGTGGGGCCAEPAE